MFYYTIFVIIAILIVDSNGKLARSLPNEPKPCCLPKQHSSQMSMSTSMILPDGKSYSSYSTYNFSFDSDRDLIAFKGEATSIPNGQKSHWWIIQKTAVYQYSSTYGYDDKQIIGDTWLITQDEAIMYFTVSNDSLCIPLNGFNYSQNPPTLNSTTVANFVPKILDSSAFDIPEECKNTT
ncbi:unnamed protein product [Rotaria sordida]|uniref:Uncharacterized protein n=1 Tax=Rotaria sordida TaxID=392033 RepID=A0A814BCK5_9BILA|nr:unnamed protein product [Rotaria sordida]CAF3919883.1 unnamed protein product [Rotaria sordida]